MIKKLRTWLKFDLVAIPINCSNLNFSQVKKYQPSLLIFYFVSDNEYLTKKNYIQTVWKL